MALTKSLHTVTAATAVARMLVDLGHATEFRSTALASAALAILGHTLDGSETSARIIANCRTLLSSAGGDA